MKPKQLLFTIFSAIIIITTSCQKDDDFIENPTFPNNAKLKRILLYPSIESKAAINIDKEYEYDENGRISKINSPMYENGEITGLFSYDLYNYNSLGQLVKIENYHANSNSPTGFINLKNYVYSYTDDGKIDKIEVSNEYSLYKYENNLLTRIEEYENSGELERYTEYEYDNSGNLIKETAYDSNNRPYAQTKHSFKNGLNIQSDIYGGEEMTLRVREIHRTYDRNNNLIIKESNELLLTSSAISYVLRYEYFEE
ncbi:hypothetical protein [uncultured Draconibacterium sp.]|uniref:hypothetical protein n=1 Tax=uncultured Draconibacterium sp. TaxID=1573823 RepID=UPI0029C80008|nr:hypothetical protein [uncultured Draconibacterium sp.]